MRKSTSLLVAIAILVGSAGPGYTQSQPAPGGPAEEAAAPGKLIQFDSCAAFLDHLKAEALERVGPYGLGGATPFAIARSAEVAAEEEASAASDAQTVPVAGVDYSTTNVQEVGVDEPDIVKTDGRRVLALARGVLYYIDVSSGTPTLVSTYDLWPWNERFGGGWRVPDNQMFLSGDTALLMISGFRFDPQLGTEEQTIVLQIDLSEPEVLAVARTLTIEGRLVSARLVGDRAALVISSGSRIEREFVNPASRYPSAMWRAERANRTAIRESTLEHWVPGYELSIRSSSASTRGALIDCTTTYAPEQFSGFDLLSVLTFDLGEGTDIEVGSMATVMAGGDTVYASSERLYVANRRWIDRNDFGAEDAQGVTTHIHRFDVSGSDGPAYEASGSVDGFLLNQFAMSEHEGYLRVASTDTPVWGWWRQDGTSVSRVDVLQRDGAELRLVGSVGGLGQGERIYAVRFIGDIGYVVTFRQIDPLYTVDLSDPSDPRVVGELKIPGYSAYLHPIGKNVLLGVGQDADELGRVLGTQVSVFDVSDLANPVRTHQFKLPRSSRTEVEFNHRAFLYRPQTGLAVLPIGWWGYREGSGEWESYQGAIAFQVGPEGIERLGMVEHEYDKRDLAEVCGAYRWPYAPIRRSFVIGQRLFTLSDAGLKGSDLSSLSDSSWTRFPLRPSVH